MAARGSLSAGDEVELAVLLPDGRTVAHAAPAGCPIMDLLVQIASRENLKPSAYVIEAVDAADETRPPIKYKPNTPVGQLNTKVIRLTEKNSSATKMAPPSSNGPRARDSRISHSESFSNRVHNFNKMAGVSAVQICNDPDGFSKLSEDTKRIKSRSNFITSALPPQVSGDAGYTTSSFMNTFRLQIHLPYEQLHVIRASPDYTVLDVLDIIRDERGLKLERYSVHKTNEPDLNLNLKSTLKENRITELTLSLLPEFEIKRSVNPKKVKKENSSHFRSAFKSFFQQLKPSSRSNSVSELSLASESTRPKSEPPRMSAELGSRLSVQPRAPPRKRGQAPPPPPPAPGSGHAPSGLATPRSHTASESSCESAGEGSVGGSAPATLPRRCRLAPASASTTDLAAEAPLPPLRRGVSDMAVNKPKFARRKRAAPKPPTPISAEELVEDGLEEQAALQKPPLIMDSSSHAATEVVKNAGVSTSHIANSSEPIEDHALHIKDGPLNSEDDAIVPTEEILERFISHSNQLVCDTDRLAHENQLVQDDNKSSDKDCLFVQSTNKEVPSSPQQYRSVYNEAPSLLNVEKSISDFDQLNSDFDLKTNSQMKKVLRDKQSEDIETTAVMDGKHSLEKQNKPANKVDSSIQKQEIALPVDVKVNQNYINKLTTVSDKAIEEEKHSNEFENTSHNRDHTVQNAAPTIHHNDHTAFTEDRLVSEAKEPVTPLVNIAPVASQPASDDQVDCPVAVDIPDLRVVSMPQPIAEIVDSHSHNGPPLLLNAKANHLRSTKPLQPSSVSSSAPVSKPSVDDILKQIQKIKNKKQLKRSQSNVEKIGSKPHEFAEPKRVISVPSHNHIDNITISHKPGVPASISDTLANTVESIPSPKVVEEKPPDRFTKPRSGSNGSVDSKEVETWQQATDTSNGPIERRHMDADSGPARSRVLTKFMLTSWAEEKRAPVVNRIADYGSKGSSTQVSGGAEKALASALAATLPRPFARSHSEITTNFARPVSVNTAPTIINVVEKVNHTKVNDATANTTKRTSAYAKLNLYNMSPTILPDPRSTLYANGEGAGNAAPAKPSWELVKDASKKLAENEVNGDKALDRSNIDTADGAPVENGADREPVLRHVYKYPKPLQFQLGTWTDKTKTLKIEPETRQKQDPPLVTELDEVGVWSATY